MNPLPTAPLKTKGRHNVKFAVSGGTTGSYNDNLWYQKWRQHRQYANFLCSVHLLLKEKCWVGKNDIVKYLFDVALSRTGCPHGRVE